MRLFFALPLPDALKEELTRFQAQARTLETAASGPDPRGLHLTLAFLGEQEEAMIPALLSIARMAVSGYQAFPLKTSNLGGFPKHDSARILWLGLEEEPRLGILSEHLRSLLRGESIPFDSKPFKAHLTLARLKIPRSIARFGPSPEPVTFQAEELILFQSVQTPSGSRYVPLGSARFGL